MTRLAALALPVALCRCSGQLLEVCPEGGARASCAAANAAAGEADGVVDLVQILAARRPGGASLLASTFGIIPAWIANGTNTTPAASPEEAFSGIWLCQGSYYMGPIIANVTGGNASVHSSCGPWEVHLLGDSINVTPPGAASTTCSVVDGTMLCSNGDSCSKSNWALERLRAPENYREYVGHWSATGPGYEDEEGVNVSLQGGELFIERLSQNMTGYVHLTPTGHWQADLCYGGVLSTDGVRLQLGKSGRELSSSWLYSGSMDWSPPFSMTRPDNRKRHAFPYLLVGVPLSLLLFLGLPALLFVSGFFGGGSSPQPQADSGAEPARESQGQEPLGTSAQAKPGAAPTQG